MIPNYSHLVEVDEKDRRLTIYRVYENGRKELFTTIELPLQTVAENQDQFDRFCHSLGENLLIDSPSARKLLAL